MSPKVYDELTALPVPTSAFLRNNVVEAEFSVRDHTRNVKRTILKSISLDDQTATTVEISGIISAVYSPSGNLKAVLRETGDDKDKKRFVEIWSNDLLLACKDVTDKHGIFYADEFFSSLCFSPSEKLITYVAEKKKSTEKNAAEKFAYQQPLGEGLVGKSNPILFLFQWETDKLLSFKYDAPVFFGQALFAPNQDGKLFVTGYETAADERVLGLFYCFNRLTGIWELTFELTGEEDDNVDCHVRKLTGPHLSCRSPRIVDSNGKATLLWLSQATGGAHDATVSLHSCDITRSVDPSQTRTLVDTVWEPAKGEFPGLYLSQLPRFLHVHWGKGDYIVTRTTWGSRVTIVLISLQDGTVKELTPVSTNDSIASSWTAVLAAEGSKILCVRSFFTIPFELVLGEFDATGSVSWKVIHKPVVSERLQAKLDSLTISVIPIPGRFPTETILVQHKLALQEKKILPCITLPHGGPHGAISVAFSAPEVSLALEGYTLSIPNYTGSTGYGEKYVRALIGQCSSLDVGDCIESVRHLVKIGAASEGHGRLLLSGGSHGGFLAGHLIGQYPEVFTAAVLRNPVISAGEISTSDIQDWYFSEFAVDYPLSSLPPDTTPSTTSKATIPPRIVTPEVYTKLYHASPIAHVNKVKAAVLLLIGGSDQRVAPTQGIGYYHALKALRRDSPDDVEMLVFGGEGHAIDGPEASKVVWLRTVDWFKIRTTWV